MADLMSFFTAGTGADVVSKIVTGIQWLIVVVVIIAVVWFLLNWLKFKKVKAIIVSTRGKALFFDFDKAAVVKGRDAWFLKLKKGKVPVELPMYNCFQPGRGCSVIFLKRTAPDQYYPMNLKEVTDTNLEILIEGDKRLWGTMMWRKAREAFSKQNPLLQYLPYIGILILAIVVIVVISMLLKNIGGLAQTAEASAQILKEAAALQAQC